MLIDIAVTAADSYERKSEFNGTTNCVSAMFLLELPKHYDAGKIEKIIIELGLDESRYYLDDDILVCCKPFDFEAYWRLNDFEAKELIFEIIYNTLFALAAEFGWRKEPLENALAANKEKGYSLTYGIVKKKSPDKENTAMLSIDFGRFDARVYVRFESVNDGCHGEVDIVKTLPHTIFFDDYLGKIKWIDNKTVEVIPSGSDAPKQSIVMPY
ncbi:hypothetical protein O5O45_06840 [Hahella aquimaris]|uniref:hypothetical protein n=1 Tax=Hahella sp. HNIBRBA332 TaxID=3015983 RepID=UPI00273AD4C8|nr:hypothetical protein [Hahella sp. HNIBRBA332]WLQ15631.1 hypothetical protein O5O45_06840 [Hahella sp. HNIBRBA332]